VAAALGGFHGAERRFERHGEAAGVLVVDDYGHHPTEISAVIDAARSLGRRRIVVAFQPHRFTRTAALLDDFGPSLRGADRILLTGIYAAGEEPMPGITVDSLASAVRKTLGAPVDVVPSLEDVAPALAKLAQSGDVVITLGAGSIGSVPERLIEMLKARSQRADAETRGERA
jgi:UDP-N-acetylmuramate--alanine ligase